MRAILLLAGAAQALRPSTPQIRTKTTLRAFTNPFAKRPEEMQELQPYEAAPLFGDCRRKLAAPHQAAPAWRRHVTYQQEPAREQRRRVGRAYCQDGTREG